MIRKYRKPLCALFFIMMIFCVTSCDHKKKIDKKPSVQIITAVKQTPIHRLFFTGSLAPISSVAVESPVAGIVSTMGFTYGEHVKEHEELFSLSSHELAQNYRKDVTDYLQKKQAYQTQKSSYVGEQALYQAGVVSKDDYESTKSQYENAALSYLEAQFALEKTLRIANLDPSKIEALSLSDTNEVNRLLQQHFHDVIIVSPKTGVALYPVSRGANGDSSGKLSVGSLVKEGQLLVSIGDLSGLSASFNVSEEDIDRIKTGLPVKVTGTAFPGLTLSGVVMTVSAQANQNGEGQSGVSMFSVGVSIPSLNAEALAKIRVGMTAKFEIDIASAPRILLPIDAISQENGRSVVHIQEANGAIKVVPVLTGETSPTTVEIINGVKEGDKIVIFSATPEASND